MKTVIIIFLLWVPLVFADTPDAQDLLDRIDANLASKTQVVTAQMVIHGRRGSRTIRSKTWTQGEEKSFTEYLSPAREKGTKMLKLEDRLWLYSPSTDRIIQISGHMLRQSVMGSDLSYEDMMEDERLANHYQAEITGEQTVDDRPCWVMTLTATNTDIAYHKRTLYVDKERDIPLKQELYAKSGKLLKNMDLKDYVRIGERWYPQRFIFKDMLKQGQGTEFIVENIIFNTDIPAHIFSKAALRK